MCEKCSPEWPSYDPLMGVLFDGNGYCGYWLSLQDFSEYELTSLYRHYDASNVLLYVGITKRQDRRSSEHTNKSWWFQVEITRWEHFETRREALQAEKIAIKTEHPLYNVVHSQKGM